jgi:Predicted hydrolases or acyltransferases (alpha/beta hydrolase superfamily)
VQGRRTRVLYGPPRAAHASERQAPLLLVHGLACSADAWTPLMRAAATRPETAGVPVLAPDLPGYGHTPGPSHALDIDALADAAAAVLDAWGWERPVHVLANSMGCQVALALAHRHPRRVFSLTLQGPTVRRGYAELSRYAYGLACDLPLETPRYVATQVRMWAQMGFRRYLATSLHMVEDAPLARARQVRAPALVLRGERDRIVDEESARRLADALPRGEFCAVPGATHAMEFVAPGAFLDAWLPFRNTVERAPDGPRSRLPGDREELVRQIPGDTEGG